MGRPCAIFQKTTLRRARKAGRLKKTRMQKAAEFRQTRDKLLFGSLGAASPVRRIDPKTGEVVEIISMRE
jgi:hypothetical protein